MDCFFFAWSFVILVNKVFLFFFSLRTGNINKSHKSMIYNLLSCAMQVLQGRKHQLDEQMEELRRKQEESIESREELLRELQAVQQVTAREKEENLQRRREREEEIRGQVVSISGILLCNCKVFL